jgi:hypothetical protein
MFETMPNEVNVGWKTYAVELSPARLNSGGELYGQIDYDNGVITIRESSTPDQQKATLIHEILHAISEMYGLELEEKLVTSLANALYTVYKDNIDRTEPETVIIKKLSAESDVTTKRKSRYENDPEGGIEWLFHGNPKFEGKKIKMRVVDSTRPDFIESINCDEAITFILDGDKVECSCSVETFSNDIDYLKKKVKETIFKVQ